MTDQFTDQQVYECGDTYASIGTASFRAWTTAAKLPGGSATGQRAELVADSVAFHLAVTKPTEVQEWEDAEAGDRSRRCTDSSPRP